MSKALAQTVFVGLLALAVQIFGTFMQIVDFSYHAMIPHVLALSVKHVLMNEPWTLFFTALAFAVYEKELGAENASPTMKRVKSAEKAKCPKTKKRGES